MEEEPKAKHSHAPVCVSAVMIEAREQPLVRTRQLPGLEAPEQRAGETLEL